MRYRGTAWKLGDHVDTDVIIPARYLVTTDPQELAKHCFEDLDPTLSSRIRPGDIVVAGENFGQGSSREHAPIAIQALGVSCILAKSFARIFYRNGFNIGLPLVECPEVAEDTQTGDELEVDLANGVIRNLARQKTYSARPIPDFMLRLLQAGGLIHYVRQQLQGKEVG